MIFDAFWLPAIDSASTTSRTYPLPNGETLELRLPLLDESQLEKQVAALGAARDRVLLRRSAVGVAEAVGRVAERLLDREDPLRRTAIRLLPAVTGLSRPMVEHVLDRMATDWRTERSKRLLEIEFGDPSVLDGFLDTPVHSSRLHVVGPRLAVHVFSGNVPGVAVTSLIRSLLVKAGTLGKTASGEPILTPLFARGLAEEDPDLGQCVAVTYWKGGDAVMERVAFSRADLIVAYGSAGTIEALRTAAPARTRLVAYGNRLSFAVVAREALKGRSAEDLAADAALAVATFDQQGCVSPHVIFLEKGGEASPSRWAALLAAELERLRQDLPRGTLTPGESATIRQLRGEAEIAQIAGTGVELFASEEGTEWTVIVDPEPVLKPSCLNRTVRIVPVGSLEEVVAFARPIGEVLQTVGVAGPESRLHPLAVELARLGATRITPLDRMPWPPPWWHHDGRPPLAELVRWCEWE